MAQGTRRPSARKLELLEAAYQYVLGRGLADLSLRPLATAIGSSTRVLMFLFGSKDDLVRALLERARADELTLLARMVEGSDQPIGLRAAVHEIWTWLRADEHRALLRLWTEAYARSLVEPEGPWAGFAMATVKDWLAVLAERQHPAERDTAEGEARRTMALAILRGALLDLLATGDRSRLDHALQTASATLEPTAQRPPGVV